MTDMFNKPARNARNRNASKGAALSSTSVNAQIVQAKHRILEQIVGSQIMGPKPTVSIKSGDAAAVAFKSLVDKIGAKIGDDAELNASLSELVKADETLTFGPIQLLYGHLLTLLTPDDLWTLPMRGTDKDSPSIKGTNKIPDVFSIDKPNRKEHKVVKTKTSVYKELAYQTKIGAEANTRWDLLLAGKVGKNKEYAGQSDTWYEQETNKCSKAINLITKNLGLAVGLWQQLENVKSSKTVQAYLSTYLDDKGVERFARVGKPVAFEPVKKMQGQWKALSIGSFLSLDATKAMANGDTWKSWIDTLTEEEETDPNAADTDKAGSIKTYVDWCKAIRDIHWYIGTNSATRAARHREMLVELGKKGSDDDIRNLAEAFAFISALEPHIRARADKLAEADAAAEKQRQEELSKSNPQFTPEQQAAIEAWKAAERAKTGT